MSDGTVVLEGYEAALGTHVGSRRQLGARLNNRTARNGMREEDGWEHHVEGACGEVAVAKFLNVFWSGSLETFGKEPDLRPNIEVKTRSKHHYDLLIRKHEDLNQIFVLATGLAPYFKIRGWGVGNEIVSDKWLSSHGGRPEAWFIPASVLSTDWLELKKTHIWK